MVTTSGCLIKQKIHHPQPLLVFLFNQKEFFLFVFHEKLMLKHVIFDFHRLKKIVHGIAALLHHVLTI